jgi:hypothetical protein
MPPSRPIFGFFLKFVLVYGVLMALWPVVFDGYRAFFKTGGEFVFRVIWPRDTVRFEPLPEREKLTGNETKVFVVRRDGSGGKKMSMCIRDIGYLSTVVFVALVFAAPVSWSRRGRAFLWGLLLLHVVIVLRVTVLVAFFSSLIEPDSWLKGQTFWSRTAYAALWRLALGQPLAYISAVLVWILVTLRREDLAMVLSALPDRSPEPHDTEPTDS